jgi:hypothetical protein
MADKPQQQTLSVRITDSLRRRLERARQLASSKTGEPVSTSEIAKQFLESAKDGRLEVVDLLAQPTESLLQIRRKGEAGADMSRAEWTVLTHFVRQGVEAASTHTPNQVSRDSFIAILDAFLAVHALRPDEEGRLDTYYLGNLPAECRPAPTKRGGKVAPVDSDMVHRAVEETRRRGAALSATWQPLLAARNLYVLIEEDRLPGTADLNKALKPFWSALWRLAARGHFMETQQPVRDRAADREGMYQPPIPSVSEGDFTVHFARGASTEFSVLLSLPSARGVHYPISGYPRLNEFRSMVLHLANQPNADSWSAADFIGGVTAGEPDGPGTVWFRAHENGITLFFSREEWATVRRLFRRAFDVPDIRRAWDVLTMEYGEL